MTTPEHPAPDLRQAAVQAREALRQSIEEKADYMRLNHLGDPEETHTVRYGRAALASLDAALAAHPVQEQAGQMVSEREAFEAWAGKHLCLNGNDGDYVFRDTRSAWSAWHARALLSASPARADAPIGEPPHWQDPERMKAWDAAGKRIRDEDEGIAAPAGQPAATAGVLKVAVDLLREVVGPLEVSAAVIESEDGGAAIEELLANVQRYVEQFDRASLAAAPSVGQPATSREAPVTTSKLPWKVVATRHDYEIRDALNRIIARVYHVNRGDDGTSAEADAHHIVGRVNARGGATDLSPALSTQAGRAAFRRGEPRTAQPEGDGFWLIGWDEASSEAAPAPVATADAVELPEHVTTQGDYIWWRYEQDLADARGIVHKSHFNASAPVWFQRGYRSALKSGMPAALPEIEGCATPSADRAAAPVGQPATSSEAAPLEGPINPGAAVLRYRCKRPDESTEEYRIAMGWDKPSGSSVGCPSLPPLPEHATAWVIPGDDGGSLKEWVDAKAFSDGEFTAPLFTAAQMREYALAYLDAALSAHPVQEQAGQMVSEREAFEAAYVRQYPATLTRKLERRASGNYFDRAVQEAWLMWQARALLSASPVQQEGAAPKGEAIDMVLFCPKCGMQHIDAPDERTPNWKNEPHRSHLCHGCGHIWRPADVPTNGVAAVKTTGKDDSPLATPPRADAPIGEPAGWHISFDGGKTWEYRADDPWGKIGDRFAIVRPLVYGDGCDWRDTPTAGQPAPSSEAAPAPVVPDEQRITAAQALDALDELEDAARGDEPFPYAAAPCIRSYIESTLAAPSADRAAAESPAWKGPMTLREAMEAEEGPGIDAREAFLNFFADIDWDLDPPAEARVSAESVKTLARAFGFPSLTAAEAAVGTEAAPAPVVPAEDEWAQRREKLVTFALWRFMHHAYEQANAAAQDLKSTQYKAGAAERFLQDAKDAERILNERRPLTSADRAAAPDPIQPPMRFINGVRTDLLARAGSPVGQPAAQAVEVRKQGEDR